MNGQFTTIWQIPDKKIITIMREGNLLPFDRFQTKKLQLCERRQITAYWQIPDKKIITIMREGNLLPFDRFQTKKYNYARGQITTYWQIPDKYNNYNYVRWQLTTFWHIPVKKKITIMREGNLLPFDRFQIKK